MIRVLIADDHEMFREMLRLALPRAGDLEVVGEAADGEELQAVARRLQPDVVLLDYKMPHVPSFATLVQRLRSLSPDCQVVVLSGFSNQEVAASAARGGASGYVLKTTRLAAVADAVRSVAKGGIWIDPHLERKVFETFQRHAGAVNGETEQSIGRLTRREREVLSCVAEGSSNLDIAHKLCISERTVKTHLTRIFAKLEVKNRLAAALAFYGKTLEGAGSGGRLPAVQQVAPARGKIRLLPRRAHA
jgi:DNA-binding NarL/FixJ family response regulator